MEVVKCPNCGEENPAKFRLCGYCGTPLAPSAAALAPTELRKIVTLLFTDLKDSTVLGETLDSEALHEVKERYFAAMSAEIGRHGGRIEKYIGDAIMAVFGLPRSHEDDALRAVRAAAGMQKLLVELNKGLKARFGCELKNRTGVNTGEVVTTDDPGRDQKMATGDAVNVAARLEAAAPVNEILIGEVTYRLVRDAVQTEPVEPLTLKGKSQPVPAWRLVSVHGDDGNLRRQNAPVVGREKELAELERAWEEALTERQARLVTVIGDAGVGKTRLVREIMDRLTARGARRISGKALPYGDGITFWPLRGMVLGAASVHQDDTPEEAQQKILACVRDREVADRLASAVGLTSATFTMQDISWAARRFLQTLAQEFPVVALFDDIHWAEPMFLDLMENVLDSIEDAPVLMLATARHDLLEARSNWGERERARQLVLQPLSDADVAAVIGNLLGATGLPQSVAKKVVAAAEGNPLYVEQMVQMLIDSGAIRRDGERWVATGSAGDIEVPPTIHALLEARLDSLDRSERSTAEPASVIGMEFQRVALQSIAPAPVRNVVEDTLRSLARKHFIRPAIGSEGDARYRFDHHLVRDTVYGGLLKRARAAMHLAFVKWADAANAGADRGLEFEEILGYHLEQAYKYLRELGPLDEAGHAIGRDGATRLGSAARRALARGDMPASANLFSRACALLQVDEQQRLELLPDHAEALVGLGRVEEARSVLREAREQGERAGFTRIVCAARILGIVVRLFSRDAEEGEGAEDPVQVVEQCRPLLEQAGAHKELANCWRLRMTLHAVAGRHSDASDAAHHAATHARLAGNDRVAVRVAMTLASIGLFGPTPVVEAIDRCEAAIQAGLSDRGVEASLLCTLSSLRAMNGELEVARRLYERGREMLVDLGGGAPVASAGIHKGIIELHGGDLAAAEEQLRRDVEALDALGERHHLPAVAVLLAKVVRERGRDSDALPLLALAERLTAPGDVISQADWRAVRAPIVARQGRIDEALGLASTAVAMLEHTESPGFKADALCELGTVLAHAGRPEQAVEAFDRSAALYSLKGNVAALTRLRQLRASA